MKKRPLLYVVFLLPLILPCAAFSAHMDEMQYLALVMERNNDLAAARQEIEARLFSARAELAIQRPSLSLSAETSKWLDKNRGDQQADLSLSHRVNLSGAYGLQERDLLLGVEILRNQYADAVNERLAFAASAYRQAVMAALNREAMEQIVEKRRESLTITKEKFDKELVSLLELLRAQSQVDDGEAFLLQARQKYEQQLVEMSALAGGAPAIPSVALPELGGMNLVVDEEKAWDNRPDVAALLLSKERASVQRSLAAKGLSPFVDLSVGLRVLEDHIFPQERGGEVFVRAVLTVPLADGGKTSNSTEAATLMLRKAEYELAARRDSLKREADMVRERWNRALEIVAIRRRQAERADKELEIAELMYREGMGSQLDLINAQEADQKSRTEFLSAVQELWLVLAEADRVMGRWSQR
ncbi:MAG TPA: TolC family protein [Synergistales bacterium]|nr:TolC family protein [Synergistales bacterium]